MRNKVLKGLIWFVLIFFILISILSVVGPALTAHN